MIAALLFSSALWLLILAALNASWLLVGFAFLVGFLGVLALNPVEDWFPDDDPDVWIADGGRVR